MTDKELKRIDYQFVPVPTELVFALDPYCLKTIAVMIDKESYWKSRNKVFNGYFTLSVEELAEYLCLENRKDVRLTLEALYRAGLIDVKTEAGKRFGAKVKLNWDEMKKERPYSIEKLPRTERLTYCVDVTGTTEGTSIGTTYDTNCTATLEQEIEPEIEQEQEPEVEQEIEQEQEVEPTAIRTSSMTFEEYLQYFIDRHPYINYSYPPDKFYDTYFQELKELQTQIVEDTGTTFTIKDLSIFVYFFKTTGKLP